MATTKLTLSLDKKIIEAAKDYSARHKLSLSKLISRYFRSLDHKAGNEELPPIVTRLLGILPARISTEEHKKFLAKKYRF